MALEFFGFELDLASGRLTRRGREIQLERRVFELLSYLAQRPGRLIPKDELMREVWQAHTLSSGVMSNAVAKLRRALEQPQDAGAPLETVHGRGYRFWLEQPSAASEPLAPPASAPLADPFFGREVVIETLGQLFERARGGQLTAAVLAGSAGIGKTRTAAELAARARALGARVYHGAAHEGEASAPYWPLIQVVREMREQLGTEAFARHVPEDAMALGLIAPDLATPGNFEPATAQFQLFDEFSRLCASLSEDAPLVLMLDDLQWADRGTIDWLAFAIRSLPARPILLLATLRDDERAPDTTRAGLAVLDRLAQRITLAGLAEAAVSAIARALGSRDASDAALRALHARTGGNPFFVRQLIAAEADSMAQPPTAIRGVLLAKRDRLPARAQRTAGAAAVIGSDFTLSMVVALTSESADDTLDDLDELRRAGFVQQQLGTESFAFVHDLLRETLYGELPIRERGGLHARAAAVVAQSTDPDARAASELARHLVHALPSQLTAAAAACRSAARAAHERGAFDVAAELLQQATDKLAAENGDRNLRCELLGELGTNHFYALEPDRAWHAFHSAAEIARELDRVDVVVQLVPHLVNCVDVMAGDSEAVRSIVDLALARVSADRPADRAIVLAHKAELAFELATSDRTAMLEDARTLAAASDDAAAILEVAHSRASLRDPTTLAENRAAADDLLALMDRYPDAADTMRYRSIRRLSAAITHYLAALTGCDLAAADRTLAAIEALGRTSGVRAVTVTARFMRAGRALAAGTLDEVERIVREGFADDPSPTSSRTALVFGRFALALATARGDRTFAKALDPDAVKPPWMSKRQETEAAISYGYLFAHCRETERARAVLGRASREVIDRMPVAFGDLGSLCQLAEIAVALSDAEAATRLYAQLEPHAERNAVLPHFEYWGAVAHYLGRLAPLAGKPGEAEAHFAHAQRINAALGMASPPAGRAIPS